MPIRAVVFDVGGVISRVKDGSKIQAWEARLGLPERGLSKIIFGTEMSARAMVGQISESELWKHVGATLGLSAEQLDKLRLDFWAGWQLDAELVSFMRGLRPRYKTALLSNALSNARQAFVDQFGLGDAVDAMIISAEEGVAKPDPRIYHIALARLEVRPEAAVFVDDVLENVQAAQALHWHGVQFVNTWQTIQELTRYLNEHYND